MSGLNEICLEELSREDRKILKSYLLQMVYTYLFIVIGCTVFLFVIEYMIEESDNVFISENRFALQIGFVGLFVSVFTVIVWMKFEKPLQNLKSGRKGIVTGIVADKKTNTRWGWHTNTADFVSQPRLVEYIITIDTETYLVEKEFYLALNINDKVTLNFTYPNREMFLIQRHYS